MEYAEIYRFTREALLPLERLTSKEIPEEEVGFFSILFSGEVARQKEEAVQEKVRALIVCPNGISSSLILQTELKKIFPTVHLRKPIQSTSCKVSRRKLRRHFFHNSGGYYQTCVSSEAINVTARKEPIDQSRPAGTIDSRLLIA